MVGVDVRGFNHGVSNQAIAHTFAKHGNAVAEKARGQAAITPADFRLLPEIVRSGRYVPGIQRPFGPRRVEIVSNVGGYEYHYAAEIRSGKRRVDMITMWKK